MLVLVVCVCTWNSEQNALVFWSVRRYSIFYQRHWNVTTRVNLVPPPNLLLSWISNLHHSFFFFSRRTINWYRVPNPMPAPHTLRWPASETNISTHYLISGTGSLDSNPAPNSTYSKLSSITLDLIKKPTLATTKHESNYPIVHEWIRKWATAPPRMWSDDNIWHRESRWYLQRVHRIFIQIRATV